MNRYTVPKSDPQLLLRVLTLLTESSDQIEVRFRDGTTKSGVLEFQSGDQWNDTVLATGDEHPIVLIKNEWVVADVESVAITSETIAAMEKYRELVRD